MLQVIKVINQIKQLEKLKEQFTPKKIYIPKFIPVTKNQAELYNFLCKSNLQGHNELHLWGAKGTGKTTLLVKFIYILCTLLQLKNKHVKINYFKNLQKELEDIRLDFTQLGAKGTKENSIKIYDSYVRFGSYQERGLTTKHGKSCDILIVEELQVANNIDDIKEYANMFVRGSSDFTLIIYVYNPDDRGRNNYALLDLQKSATKLIKFLPQDNPTLFNKNPNYWDRLKLNLSQQRYKAYVLGDLTVAPLDTVFSKEDINYCDFNYNLSNRVYAYIDPAVAVEYKNGSCSSLCIVAKDLNNKYIILCKTYEQGIVDCAKDMAKVIKTYNVSKVYIEDNQGKALQKLPFYNYNIKINLHSNKDNKGDRIESLNLFNKDNILFHKDSNDIAIKQILRYDLKDYNKHSDTLDAMQGALFQYGAYANILSYKK